MPNEVFHPIAVRLLERCDGVLRVGGPSIGADEMVRVGRSLGLEIYNSLEEIQGLANFGGFPVYQELSDTGS